MSVLQLRHIKTKLHQSYENLIDTSDSLARTDEEKENVFLTRAFAAYTIQVFASISETEAAKSVTDGIDDNGIDAVYFDRGCKILWLVQTKWKNKGTGEPETGDTHKFCSGIKKIIEDNFDTFNQKVKAKRDDIEDALNDYSVKIKVVLAYTGSDTLSAHNSEIINNLLDEINEDSDELMSFESFTLSKAHKALAGIAEGKPITSEIVIENFSKIESPYKIIFGTVNGSVLATLWNNYRMQLFSENIRGFLGESSVNEEIKRTIVNSPEKFLYFNNGVTVLCDSFKKKPLAQTNAGTFELNNLHIVNGAQTVGAIGSVYANLAMEVEKTNVFIRVISLEDCPNGFSDEITRSTNTQNKIEKRDFASMDLQHDRLRTEFALLNVKYHIKRSTDAPIDEMSCGFEDIVIAVACSLNNVDLSVIAKREVGLLWDNTKAEPYISIINKNLTAIKAWRCITVMRHLTNYIKQHTRITSGRERMCLTHSNRFALHLLLNRILPSLEEEQIDFDKYMEEAVIPMIPSLEAEIFRCVEKKYKKSLVHQIFRNFTKCRDLKDVIKL